MSPRRLFRGNPEVSFNRALNNCAQDQDDHERPFVGEVLACRGVATFASGDSAVDRI